MRHTITTKKLKYKVDGGRELILVDVMSAESYEMRHLPGAKNIPNGPDFLKQFEKEIGAAKDAEIIIYCASPTSEEAKKAIQILEDAGYTHVVHYTKGVAGWKKAGNAFEGIKAETVI